MWSLRAIRVLFLPSLVALAVLPCCSCGRTSAAGESRGEARVVAKAVEDVFLLSGELRSVRSVSLTAPRSEGGGRLQVRWLAEDGAEVKAGERVAEFDPTSLIQRLEERRLRLRQAELSRESLERSSAAEAERRRAAVEKAEIEDQKSRLEASVPLEYRDPKDRPTLQSKWQQTLAALEKARLDRDAYAVAARADVTAARSAEEKARRELETAEQGLVSMSLAAPRAGIFLVGMNLNQWGPDGPRKLQPGDNVWPGFPIGTIPDPAEMEAQAVLAEADHGRIAAGMPVRCVLDTYPDRVFRGRIEEVGSVAAEALQNWSASTRPGFPVRVALARTDPLMRPGLSVRIEVVRRSWAKALSVPRGAVRFEKDGPVARKDGARVPLRLASCTPTECVVEAGLAEGDRVALF
ncbi:MAG: efflux RND transporter periplasmic adaptor subunit [Betaproteobacteria bacterium]